MTQTTDDHAGTETAPARPHKAGWFERRRQRRRKRIIFEEIMGWLLVPFILYFLYLGYVAVGGLPPAAKDVIKEVTSGVFR